ncbi:MAG: hypothetical protein ACNI27_12120 [Desulfovibrio sp.]
MNPNRSLYFILVLLLAMSALAGCTAGKSRVAASSLEQLEMMSDTQLSLEANQAWLNGNFDRSELLYSRYIERPSVSVEERRVGMQRLSVSAYKAGHYHQARIALENWLEVDPKAETSWQWHDMYLRTLSALDRPDRIERHLTWILSNPKLDWGIRFNTGLWFADLAFRKDEYTRGLAVLSEFYMQAPSDEGRVLYEKEFLDRLKVYSSKQLGKMSLAVTPSNQWSFPYAMVVFDRAARLAQEKNWPAIWRTMNSVLASAHLSDKLELQRVLTTMEAEYGVPETGVAVALPLTGRYASVGWKIVRGIGAAQWELARKGMEFNVKIINTEAKDWEKQIKNLPQSYSLIGGPLRTSDFEKVNKPEMLAERAFFTFLPGLGENVVEGLNAWRFFVSPKDQVRMLMDMTVNELDIHEFAILYPNDSFGKRMAGLFKEQAMSYDNATILKEAVYPPKEPTRWGRVVSELLDVPDDFQTDTSIPLEPAEFKAVFMPDGWSQAQLLAPNFFFYEASDLVFLGSEAWSRGLDRAGGIDEDHYFFTAACPGAWSKDSEGAMKLNDVLSAEGLGKGEFWTALGYDFIQFASRMKITPMSWNAVQVNEAIAKAQKDMTYSMAPLVWDDMGQVSQQLFLFTPRKEGKVALDVERLKLNVEKASERREIRLKAYEERVEREELEAKEAAMKTAAETQVQVQ